MKILAFADIHGDRKRAKEHAEMARKEKVDLVVICGDISKDEEDITQLLGVFKGMKVLFIPGNHDGFTSSDFWSEMYGFKNLHGSGEIVGDVGFFGCGFANVGLTAMTDEEMFAMLKKGYSTVKNAKKKIMLTHNHPSGTTMEKFSHFVPGSGGVKKALDLFQPEIAFCSHIHEAEGMEEKVGSTKLINVGRRGRILEV